MYMLCFIVRWTVRSETRQSNIGSPSILNNWISEMYKTKLKYGFSKAHNKVYINLILLLCNFIFFTILHPRFLLNFITYHYTLYFVE